MAEKFTLTPQQVANLDPFGARRARASEGLKDLLDKTPEVVPERNNALTADMEREEETKWSEILGATVEIKPPPGISTETISNLEEIGMELRFIPEMDLDIGELKRRGVSQYLKDLNSKYPNWKPYEALRDNERSDHTKIRNLREWYWDLVKDSKVDAPELPGRWVAVETLEKPEWGGKYPDSPLTRELGFSDRFNVSWNDAKAAIDRIKGETLDRLGIADKAEMRLLEPLEWNLLGNREGWGKTNSYEWLNTEYRESGDSDRLVVGDSDRGGAARVDWGPPDVRRGGIGFRVAVVFEP